MAKSRAASYVYEGMFMVEASRGRRAEQDVITDIAALIQKHGGALINAGKWMDRDLAYPIHKQHQKYTRAVYFLAHFSGPGGIANELEREVQISNWLIRALITRDEDGTGMPEQGKEPALAGAADEGEAE